MSFNVTAMLNGLTKYVSGVQTYLQKLETSTGGAVSLSTMFQLQFKMQVMAQYTEAVSNSLSAVHNEMITMARATKGQ